MANPPWFEQLQAELVQQELPGNYVQRFVEELSDHVQDLMEEKMSTEADVYARLGRPEHVANAAGYAFRHRGFLGRHPSVAMLVFAVSPVVALGLSTVCVLFLLYGIAGLLGWIGDGAGPPEGNTRVLLAHGVHLAAVILPSILLAVVYCKLARRLGLGLQWMFTSCVVLALLGEAARVQVKFADGSGHGQLAICLGASFDQTIAILQLLVPLAVACWFMQRNRQSSTLQPAP